jgi:dihydrofolate synthase / folylpolyglutamate synthase
LDQPALDIETFLQRFARFGVHLGLEASEQLLDALGNPHRRVPIIHVAGSNGKGSVCAYLSAVLTEAGYRVGRYTSPHLVSWTERICLNEKPIGREALWDTLHQVQAAITLIQSTAPDFEITQFEVITAAMWLYFAQQKVDIAVVEVGLGGRLDATNVVDDPLVSVITSISLEHTERLGSTLAAIATEKAGIIKPDCPAIIGPLEPEAAAVVHRATLENFCATSYPLPAKDLGNGWALYEGLEQYDLGEEEVMYSQIALQYQLPLQGEIQLQNSALAVAALQELRQQGWKLDPSDIANGIAKTSWPGRLQWKIWRGHKILIDGAHNPASAAVLRQFVDGLDRPNVHWVMGMLSTKGHREIFETLLRPGDSLYLVPVPDHHSAPLPALATLAASACSQLKTCDSFEDVKPALLAATQAVAGRELTVLCGSLYLVGHFLDPGIEERRGADRRSP